jgi:hypothetical protein
VRPRMAALLIAGLAGFAACTADTGSYGYGTGYYGNGTGYASGYGYDAGPSYVAPPAYGYYGGGYVGVPAYGYGGYGWRQDGDRDRRQWEWRNGGAERFLKQQQNEALIRQQALQNQATIQQNQAIQRYNQLRQGQAIARYNQQVQENQAIRAHPSAGRPAVAADRQ